MPKKKVKAVKKVAAKKKVAKKKAVKTKAPKIKKIETPKLADAYPIYLVNYMVREFIFNGLTEARRAVKEGRVTLNGEVVTEKNIELQPKQEVNIEIDAGSGSKL